MRDVEAWGVVVVGRRALDVLRSARVRRDTYVGPWLPEPVLGAPVAVAAMDDPADRVTLDDAVSYALLVALETLTPAERTAWVLHDLFGVPFTEVAAAVGRTAAAVRQLAARARRHITAGAVRVEVDAREHRNTVAAFLYATATGDLAGLLAVLDPDVTVTSDGGGEVSAARRPVRGADRAARLLLGPRRQDAPAVAAAAPPRQRPDRLRRPRPPTPGRRRLGHRPRRARGPRRPHPRPRQAGLGQ